MHNKLLKVYLPFSCLNFDNKLKSKPYKTEVHTSSGIYCDLWSLGPSMEAAGMAFFQAVPQKYSKPISSVFLSTLQEPL